MKYRKGYKYQLAEDFEIQTNFYPFKNIKTKFISLNTDGFLIIMEGYAWDGPSGPTIDTKDTMVPSLVHDAFYQLMRMELIPQEWRLRIDDLIVVLMKARRSKIEPLRFLQTYRANAWGRQLKRWASGAASPKNIKKVYEVL